MKRTKIVATIGPSSQNRETLKSLFLSGVNIARLNFSHGDLEQKKEMITLIRELSTELNLPIAILADLPGPKLRLGEIEGTFEIHKGDTLTFGLSSAVDLPIQYDFTSFVREGQRMFLNDGLVEPTVICSSSNYPV
jgi:pyruvate kinase